MKIRYFYFTLIIWFFSFEGGAKCYSQKLEFHVLDHYSKCDSIFFKIKILSTDSIFFPTECEFFHNGVDIYPMFTLFECEVKNRGAFEQVKKVGYDLNSVYLYLTDSIKATLYECESIVTAMGFKKGYSYRVRFIVHFERFNLEIPMYISEWFYFKT